MLCNFLCTRDLLSSKFPKVEVRTVVMDFSKVGGTKDAYANVQKELDQLNIGVLVNNVGISYDYPMYMNELPADRVEDLIEMNIGSLTRMTKMVLPGMEKRKNGAIINIGIRFSPLQRLTFSYPGTQLSLSWNLRLSRLG